MRTEVTMGSRLVGEFFKFGRFSMILLFESAQDKTNKMACATSEDSEQPGHPPSLIRIFVVRSVGS